MRRNKMDMEGYLSHFSAAALWDIPYLDAVIGIRTASDAEEVTVSPQAARSVIGKGGKRVHSTKLDLPSGAVVLHKGRRVASPELLFLEFANELPTQKLILFGLQLCSHPPGRAREAITTKEKIAKFLAKVKGHNGCRKALRAVKYIENGSASIMESLLYMILTLPHALGGFGLSGAVFNKEFELRAAASAQLGQNYCYVDLYYAKPRIAVEYDSKAHHGTDEKRGEDLMRTAVLERQGIGVMSIGTDQLYNRGAVRYFALNLAARMGKRVSIRTAKFEEMHMRLRGLLPNARSELINFRTDQKKESGSRPFG